MDELKIFLLGVVQGLTEFLPVSSSGHIEIYKYFFNINLIKNQGLEFSLVLHFATALSTLWVFQNDILLILKNKTKKRNIFLSSIIISMIPASIVGLFFEDYINVFFDSNILFVGMMLIITSVLLYKTDKLSSNSRLNNITIKNGFIIGTIQALAILPGISRSGATIAMAVLLGINKSEAAKFSFLMVIPLIFGSMAKKLFFSEVITFDFTASLFTAFISAFVTGILACRLMIKIVENSKLKYFAFYCFILGFFVISYGVIQF